MELRTSFCYSGDHDCKEFLPISLHRKSEIKMLLNIPIQVNQYKKLNNSEKMSVSATDSLPKIIIYLMVLKGTVNCFWQWFITYNEKWMKSIQWQKRRDNRARIIIKKEDKKWREWLLKNNYSHNIQILMLHNNTLLSSLARVGVSDLIQGKSGLL